MVSVAVEVVMYGSPVTVAVVVTWTLVGVTVAVVELCHCESMHEDDIRGL